MSAGRSMLLSVPLLAVLACTGGEEAPAPGPPAVHTAEFLSPKFHIDRIYRSMDGPTHTQPVSFSNGGARELIWITSVDMEAVDVDGIPIAEQDKLCHVNINFRDRAKWQETSERLFGGRRGSPAKWFVLVQGQYSIHFPEGFGIPMYTDEPLDLYSMLFNLDPELSDLDMRIRFRFHYLYHRELTGPMTALSRGGIESKVAATDDHHEEQGFDPHSCGLHADANQAVGEEQDKTETLFMVPPGRHVYRNSFRLREDLRVHYIYAHLHLFGESIELVDTTTSETVFHSTATPNATMTGIDEMTHFAGAEPIVLLADHEYELVSTYDNKTDAATDAMAMFYLYFEDPNFVAPPLPRG